MLFSSLKYVLYFYISTLRNMCAAPNTAVYCSSLISCFPGMLLRYCVSNFEMVSFVPIFTGIAFASTFHVCSISRSFYFNNSSASFLITFLSPFLLSWYMMSGLLLGIVPFVHTCWFHNMVNLPS
jgi:hypothetical protein